ncbi:hypothetical protein [Ciceribacter sp. L1K22]|uniref:hypothetical protein n=1 Tax=Ciceribacter sp. L1K22 TaxID=2820275 RepID=UPI001ABDE71B|nr:hypothetical protein [Ciceribacter sp. L1K22]MBO3761673.1 hypothetical protein [Ciceribacter sp. L1K22]
MRSAAVHRATTRARHPDCQPQDKNNETQNPNQHKFPPGGQNQDVAAWTFLFLLGLQNRDILRNTNKANGASSGFRMMHAEYLEFDANDCRRRMFFLGVATRIERHDGWLAVRPWTGLSQIFVVNALLTTTVEIPLPM